MVLRLVGWNPTWLIFVTPSLSKESSKSGTTWHFVSNQMAAGIPNPRTLFLPRSSTARCSAWRGHARGVQKERLRRARGAKYKGGQPSKVLKVVWLKNKLLKKTANNLSEIKPAKVLREKSIAYVRKTPSSACMKTGA